MSYTDEFEAACRTFFANLAAEMDNYSESMTAYKFEVDATGSTVKGIDVKFQVGLGSHYMGGDAPKGTSIRGVLTEAFRRKGWSETHGEKKLFITAAKKEDVPDYSAILADEIPF